MNPNTAPVAAIRLTCQPNKAGNALVFPYKVENLGPADAYVMDAVPSVDPATRKARANDQAVVVLLGPGDDALLGKFVAPLPTDRRIAMPVVPLARYLPAGQAFESRLTVPLPLAETSPYFADLPLRRYEIVEIKGVVFTIGYWVAGANGLAALPVEYSPHLFTVVTRNTVASATQVSQRFPVNRLQLFRRTDQFPRATGGSWASEASEGELLASGIRAPAA